MKKIVNSIIALLSFVCLIGAVKLSSLPLFPLFSEKSFWYTSPTARESFSLLYDIFVGFLLSGIFYFFVEVIPEILKLHRGKKLICHYINILLEHMEQIISITRQVFQIDADEIYLKDLVQLNGNTAHSHEEVSYSTTIFYNSGKRKTGIKSGEEFDNIIRSCIATIETQLQNIRRYDSFLLRMKNFLKSSRVLKHASLFPITGRRKAILSLAFYMIIPEIAFWIFTAFTESWKKLVSIRSSLKLLSIRQNKP